MLSMVFCTRLAATVSNLFLFLFSESVIYMSFSIYILANVANKYQMLLQVSYCELYVREVGVFVLINDVTKIRVVEYWLFNR